VVHTMSVSERNRHIFEIRKAHPTWSYQDIAELVALSRQRVQQIVRQVEECGIIDTTMENNNDHPRLDGQPISATQAARETGIPYGTISKWVSEGEVRVIEHPGHACTGKPVLLDPVSLQERIARYQPRPRRTPVAV